MFVGTRLSGGILKLRSGDGTDAIVIDASQNVGIGTSSPCSVRPDGSTDPVVGLQITNSISGNDAVLSLRNDNNTQGLDIWSDTNAGTAYIDNIYDGAGADINFRVRTLGTTIHAMTIDGAGSVGIGTASPLEALHISSSEASATPVLLLENTNANNLPAQINFYKNTSDEADDDNLGQIDFEGNDDGANRTIFGRIISKSTDVSDGSEDGNIVFSTMKAGTLTETLRLESGSVGIGVTPSTKLHVKGSGEIFRIENDTNAVGNTFMSFYTILNSVF